jgi:hypothetical protein
MYGIPGVPMLPPDGASMAFPLEQPKNLFRYGEQTIWSTQMFQGAAGGLTISNGTFRVFTTPLGQVGQGFGNALSIAETNLKEGGRIPSGVAYDVFGVSCHIMVATAVGDTGTLSPPMNGAILGGTNSGTQVVVNLTNNLVLTWDFTQTQVDIAPASLVGAGGGIFGSIAVSDDDAVALQRGAENNGNGALWLYRKHPVALPGNSTFAMLLRFGSRAGTLAANQFSAAVKVSLLGYYKNVIEIG